MKAAVSLGSVIQDVLKTCRPQDDSELTRVWSLWLPAVGPAVAANTRPAAFKGRLLLVHVNSSVWLQELQFLKADIIANLNAALGRELVGEIKFKIGCLDP
jgi:predicted nucleic acid-binding Zn ribbon protein